MTGVNNIRIYPVAVHVFEPRVRLPRPWPILEAEFLAKFGRFRRSTTDDAAHAEAADHHTDELHRTRFTVMPFQARFPLGNRQVRTVFLVARIPHYLRSPVAVLASDSLPGCRDFIGVGIRRDQLVFAHANLLVAFSIPSSVVP